MSAKQKYNTPVAIIGMGCFFPQASGLKNYWRLILNGEDSITEVPDTHWSATDYFDADLFTIEVHDGYALAIPY